MRGYPDLSRVDKADHLVFDLGFSYALLREAKNVLTQIVVTEAMAQVEDQAGNPFLVERIEQLIESIGELEIGRLQVASEIYDNAAAAAERGMST